MPDVKVRGKGKAPKWFHDNIKTGDWRPGNKGATPLWYQAGMRGMSVAELKSAKKAAQGMAEELDARSQARKSF